MTPEERAKCIAHGWEETLSPRAYRLAELLEFQISAAVSEEREACAKLCADVARQLREMPHAEYPDERSDSNGEEVADDCAERIRSRG
jgi:hypothetical protein